MCSYMTDPYMNVPNIMIITSSIPYIIKYINDPYVSA